ncbi:hypothetical protein [Janthinobacterium fluminis]|uniref:Uncharacterized protein n=1 Tax=Janthinobacterium fluminis TaxID=2987524 RepID=A0ABT5K0A3_9BURK|nr:hypothetical protein [Janthinobacterium fluminis]MDC8757843.1 hypothetical protein [Janthinobacterium fluminis]
MTDRPLMQRTIVDLEAMFSSSPTDANVLVQLAAELKHRHVPRALALDQKVQNALNTANKSGGQQAAEEPSKSVSRLKAILAKARAKQAEDQQGELWSEAQPATTSSVANDATTASPTRTPKPDALLPQHQPPASSDHSMSVEDAYRILRAKPGATWEDLEMTRRQMVQTSSPANTTPLSSTERSKLLSDARRVNLAYATLCDASRTFIG